MIASYFAQALNLLPCLTIAAGGMQSPRQNSGTPAFLQHSNGVVRVGTISEKIYIQCHLDQQNYFRWAYTHSMKLFQAILLPSISSPDEFADPKSNERQDIKRIDKYNDPNMLLPHMFSILKRWNFKIKKKSVQTSQRFSSSYLSIIIYG